MRIAAIQMHSGPDSARNLSRSLDLARIAVEKGAKVVCYPELFLTPWFPKQEDPSLFSLAAEDSSDALRNFADVSAGTGSVIIVPFFEAAKGKYYNSAAVFDSGRLLGVYRKVHLPDLPRYREQFYFSPGDTGFPVFETSQGRIGIQICWDNLFPEGSRILALKGAEVIIAPTASSQDTHSLWEQAVTANAFANNLFIFRVNRVGREDGLCFYGRSFCAGPWGELVSERAAGTEAIVLADANTEERASAAETWGFLRHRRPEAYRELTER